ncbi:MAG: amidohydrolase family protein [Thermoleophilia bacterium]
MITGIGELPRLPDDEVIDLAGAFLVSGLVDAHVHLALGGSSGDATSAGGAGESTDSDAGAGQRAGASPASSELSQGAGGGRAGDDRGDGRRDRDEPPSPGANARRHLEAGVTAVRDLGGGAEPLGDDSHARQPGRAGLPRIVWSGGALTRCGRYGGFLGTALGPDDDLAAAVRDRAAAGAEVVKVILTGSVDFQRGVADPPHFSSAELRLMIDVAHSLGIPVAVHANGAAAVRMAAEAGADSVEHGILADERSLEALAACGCVWVPTLTPLYALAGTGRRLSLPRIMAAHEGMVARADAEGVRIAAGTDAGSPGVPHGSLLTEIALLRRAGLGPAAARDAATSVGADLLGSPPGYGRPAAGAVTDLVWFERDPFAGAAPEAAAGVRPLGVLQAPR